MNIRPTTILLALLLALPATGVCQSAPVTALVGGALFDGTGRGVVEDATVLVEGDRIKAVGGRADVYIPAGARVVDVSGKWLVPGLVDTHIHFFQSGGLYTRPDIIDLTHLVPYEREVADIKKRLEGTFKRYLASGITAVVDMGGPFWNFHTRDLAAATAEAPRVAVAGPLISTVSRPQLDLGDPPIIKAATPKDARRLVKLQLEQSPDLVKIWFILPPSGDVSENLDVVKAAIDEAHKGGVRVAVHATQLETARAAVLAGADILVHSVDDKPVDEEFVGLLKMAKVIYCPTLIVLEGYAEVLGGNTRLLEIEERVGDPFFAGSWSELAAGGDSISTEKNEARRQRFLARAPVMRANLKAVHDAGVTVAAGTDAGNIGTLHGPSLHREFQLMADAGLSPEEILVAATRNAATVFAREPNFGTVETGKLADLLVLDADPLEDVGNLQRIHRVVKGGRILDPAVLVPQSPTSVVQRQVEAYNARDIEAFLSFYAEDAVLARHPGGEVIATGREEMREIYGKLFAESPELDCNVVKRIALGDMVVDHELVRGHRGRSVVYAVAIYEVKGGLIRRVWFLPK